MFIKKDLFAHWIPVSVTEEMEFIVLIMHEANPRRVCDLLVLVEFAKALENK